MLLSDKLIRDYAKNGMIENFIDYGMGGSRASYSYGLSSCGYDLRLGDKFIGSDGFSQDAIDGGFVIGPGESVLAFGVERINMPRNIAAHCVGKSTWARKFIEVLVTPIEPGWSGDVTIEIVNLGREDQLLKVGEGICQLQFFEIAGDVEMSYLDKSGKYQGQTGVTKAR